MTSGESSPKSPRRNARLVGSAAARAHLTLLLGLAFCAFAFWFELRRAESGNGLSWAYVFEWPLLGGFAVYMWWKIIHPDEGARARAKQKKTDLAPEFQGMLEGWQAHQRDLEVARETEGAHSPPHDTGHLEQ